MLEEALREHELRRTKMRPSPEDWEVFAAFQKLDVPQRFSNRWAIYNAAATHLPEIPGTIFVSRAVDMKNVREGEPDGNVLPVYVIDPSGKYQRLKDLELPVNEETVNWEDPRVGADRTTLGFTVVIYKDGEYKPHPALVTVGIKDGNLTVLGNPQIFENLTGKNVVPLKDGFIYRPYGASHQLHYLNSQGKLLRTIDFLNFRNIEWLSKKMGATARPIELEGGRKLLFIHGVREGQGIDGSIKDDIYAIGIALLDKTWRVLAVGKKPLLERKDYLDNLQPSEDLRSEKEVVYLCDFMEEENGLILLVNVGDRITVFTRFQVPNSLDSYF